MIGNGSCAVKESSVRRMTRRLASDELDASWQEVRVVGHDTSATECIVSRQLTPVAVCQESVLDAEIELATTSVIARFSNS